MDKLRKLDLKIPTNVRQAQIEVSTQRREFLIEQIHQELDDISNVSYYNILNYLEQIRVCNDIINRKNSCAPIQRTVTEYRDTEPKTFWAKIVEHLIK